MNDLEDGFMEPLHEHNQKTYENICRMYGEGIQRVAVVQPTGSGKSLLMAKLIEDNPDSRFFVLSTSHKINDQFKSKLDEKILDNLECNIYWNMPNMKQEVMESLQPDYIFLDEMHRALAKEWSKGINVLLNMYPDAKVLGLSATPIRYLDKCRNVVNELFGGNLACDMSLSQAILDGILPMARYVCGVYSYEKDTESLNKKIEKSTNSDEEKKELLKELKILKENLDKGHGVSDIFRKYIMSGNEKFVVFLKNTTHLRAMKPVIEEWFLDAGFNVRLYEVHCKNADKDREFQAFREDKEDGIKLCLSVNMLAEGIHGDIDGVIMLRETISANMYFQMIGRAFACGKKTIPLIIDLVANSQFISDAADNFPNELRGEIEKRKRECEKEGKEYKVGFDVNEFIVMDEFMDVVSGFRAIEGRLSDNWDAMFQEYCKFYEENGHGDVPNIEEYRELHRWCKNQRKYKSDGVLKERYLLKLNEIGFIWDVQKYRFEKNVTDCIIFYEKNGRLPSEYSESETEKKLIRNIRYYKGCMSDYPQWKQDLLKKIPTLFDERVSGFDRFYKMALIYKQRYGHIDIKQKDVIDGYKIGNTYSDLIKDFKIEKLTDNQVNQLKYIGIDITMGKLKRQFKEKIQLSKKALSEGVEINIKSQVYQGINLYTWYLGHKDDFSKEEIQIMQKLIPNHVNKRVVNIIDLENGKISKFPSISEAGKALYNKFHVVDDEKKGKSIISTRLTGATKNPIYKGRFRFEYADDERGDDKAS